MGLRQNIKHNFLKQIQFRMDFNGLLDTDIEKSVLEIRQKMFEKEFFNFENRIENQVDFQVKIDLNIPEENPSAVRNTRTNSISVFRSNDDKKRLEISKDFMTLTLSIDKDYNTFDEYLEILIEVINSLKDLSPFFKVIRIGLRKINLCFVDSLTILPEYFKSLAFNTSETLDSMKDFGCKASNLLTIFEKKPFLVNYVRNLQEGTIMVSDGQSQITYQVVLDIDVFCESLRNISLMLKDKNSIREMLVKQNTIAFECYMKSLTEDFLEKLQQQEFNDEHIREVI